MAAAASGATADAPPPPVDVVADRDVRELSPGAELLADLLALVRSRYSVEAMLAVADQDHSLIITGQGDVLEPEDGLVAIGSGGAFAQSAAKALLKHSDLSPEAMVRESLAIAASICVYTNENFVIETLP